MRKYLLFYFSILFPRRCFFCGQMIQDELCCVPKLYPYIAKGHHLKNTVYTLSPYDVHFAKILHEIKFKGSWRLLSSLIQSTVEYDFLKSYDCITYVPISAVRLFERGFNVSKQIAKLLGKMSGIPYQGLLKKQHQWIRQSKRKYRYRAATNEFLWILDCNQYHKILICDDIMTTGTTFSSILAQSPRSLEIDFFTLFKT